MKVTKNCETCGVLFTKVYARARTEPRFCCRKCADENTAFQRAKATATANTRFPGPRTKNVLCKSCGIPFSAPAVKRQRSVCSRKCQYKLIRKWPLVQFACVVCGKNCHRSIRPHSPRPQYCSHACMGRDENRRKMTSRQTKMAMAKPDTRKTMLEAIRERSARPEWKERRRQIMLAAYARGCFTKNTDTQPALLVQSMLIRQGIAFDKERVIGPYSFDFSLPEFNALIEVQGDYWHGNPSVYSDGQLTGKQKRRINIDKTKASYAANHGFPMLALWERDITNRPKWCESQIRKLCKDCVAHV